MTISASSLKFVAAARMSDDLNPSYVAGGSGGPASASIVQTGVENNVFPDVMPTDRITGKRQLRLVYPRVLSNDNDMLSNARAMVLDRPSDANVEICALLRAATAADAVSPTTYYGALALDGLSVPLSSTNSTGTIDGTDLNKINSYSPGAGLVLATDILVGDKVLVQTSGGGTSIKWATVSAVNLGSTTMSFAGTSPFTAGALVQIFKYTGIPSVRLSAPALTTASLSAAATTIAVDRLEVRVHPVGASSATPGIVSTLNAAMGGKAPAFVVGGLVLIQHASTSVREIATIARINYSTGVLTFAAGVANAYSTGSKITALLDMGNLQAISPITPFSQQAWTRSWADTAVSLSIAPLYTGPVALLNEGAITDRWAIVFTSSTAFYLLSERFGQIATGTTATDFAPLNPMTSQPYFTLASSGWTAGRLPGNVVRFNTQAAESQLFVARTISPSSAGGTVNGSLAVYGDINA